jgi:hypothetical protein
MTLTHAHILDERGHVESRRLAIPAEQELEGGLTSTRRIGSSETWVVERSWRTAPPGVVREILRHHESFGAGAPFEITLDTGETVTAVWLGGPQVSYQRGGFAAVRITLEQVSSWD